MALSDLELVLVIVCAAVTLVLSCTCCCMWFPSDRKDAHIRTGAQRRQAMKAYFDSNPDPEPAGIRRTEKYVCNSRGMALFTQIHEPVDRASWRGLVCICHGFGDNTSWGPRATARHYAAHGFVVASIDYEGHGQSDGLLALVEDFDRLVGDVAAYFDTVRASYPDLTPFLYGESMGGAVALKVSFLRPNAFQGAVLAAPMVKIADEMKPPQCVIDLMVRLSRRYPTPALTPVPDVLDLAFKLPERLAWARACPTMGRSKPRLATGRECLAVSLDLEANLPRVTIPFLVLHGAADQVTDPLVSKALYAEASSTDKTIKLYDGAWHALAGGEPEPLASQIRKDEVDWLLARAQGAGAPAAATATATPASAGSGESKGEPQGANSTSSSQHEGDVLLSIQQ